MGGLRRRARLWMDNPRLALAIRAAIAANLAWFAAGFLPAPAAEYQYYAPFGAVVATTFSLAGSVRDSLQAVAGIAVGGAIAWIVGLFAILPAPLAIGITVAAGVLAAGIRWLGPMGGWVPTAAVFTLIVGHGEGSFVGAFAGLTLLGGGIGVAVNAVRPPLPLAPARAAMESLQRALAAQFELLADHLESPDQSPAERVHLAARKVQHARAELHAAMYLADEAQRGNRRSPRYRDAIAALEADSARLDRLVLITDDLDDLLRQEQYLPWDGTTVLRLRPELWPAVIDALRCIATALRAGDSTEEDPPNAAVGVQEALGRLAELPAGGSDSPTGQRVLIDSILLALRRGLDAL